MSQVSLLLLPSLSVGALHSSSTVPLECSSTRSLAQVPLAQVALASSNRPLAQVALAQATLPHRIPSSSQMQFEQVALAEVALAQVALSQVALSQVALAQVALAQVVLAKKSLL